MYHEIMYISDLLYMLSYVYVYYVAETIHINGVLIINPRRMRRRDNYGSCFVCVYVCVCYHEICSLYVKNKVSWGSLRCFQGFVVWPSLKTLCSTVLASFLDCHCLPRFLTSSRWTEETAIASFQRE